MDRQTQTTYWTNHLAGWRQSGLTQRAYRARQGIWFKIFSHWRTQELAGQLNPPTPITPALTLIPVTSTTPKASVSAHKRSTAPKHPSHPPAPSARTVQADGASNGQRCTVTPAIQSLLATAKLNGIEQPLGWRRCWKSCRPAVRARSICCCHCVVMS